MTSQTIAIHSSQMSSGLDGYRGWWVQGVMLKRSYLICYCVCKVEVTEFHLFRAQYFRFHFGGNVYSYLWKVRLIVENVDKTDRSLGDEVEAWLVVVKWDLLPVDSFFLVLLLEDTVRERGRWCLMFPQKELKRKAKTSSENVPSSSVLKKKEEWSLRKEGKDVKIGAETGGEEKKGGRRGEVRGNMVLDHEVFFQNASAVQSMSYLLQLEDVLVEVKLQVLVCIVDAQLLERVHLEILWKKKRNHQWELLTNSTLLGAYYKPSRIHTLRHDCLTGARLEKGIECKEILIPL